MGPAPLGLTAAHDANGAAGALGLGESLRSTMNRQVIEAGRRGQAAAEDIAP